MKEIKKGRGVGMGGGFMMTYDRPLSMSMSELFTKCDNACCTCIAQCPIFTCIAKFMGNVDKTKKSEFLGLTTRLNFKFIVLF